MSGWLQTGGLIEDQPERQSVLSALIDLGRKAAVASPSWGLCVCWGGMMIDDREELER